MNTSSGRGPKRSLKMQKVEEDRLVNSGAHFCAECKKAPGKRAQVGNSHGDAAPSPCFMRWMASVVTTSAGKKFYKMVAWGGVLAELCNA
eukprot:1935237-Amphidinium_carterae.1